MAPGDVLVVPHSDVAWTPLFGRAGAVIAGSGGMLSHSSIVARERGIPCVVSLPDALRLADGPQPIRCHPVLLEQVLVNLLLNARDSLVANRIAERLEEAGRAGRAVAETTYGSSLAPVLASRDAAVEAAHADAVLAGAGLMQ